MACIAPITAIPIPMPGPKPPRPIARPAAKRASDKWVFADDKLTIHLPEGKEEVAVDLDPFATPKAADLTALTGKQKGQTILAIYALDGDTLTICDNAPNLDKGRPTALEAKSGSGYVLVTFKRGKP